MSKLWNSVEVFQLYEGVGYDKMQRKQLIKRITTHFGEDLAILSACGLANVLVFKSKTPKLLDLVDDEEDEGIDTVAKKIVKEVKSVGTDKSKYDVRLTDETLTEPVSDKLLSLLGQLSVKLDKHNPAYMIGNMITGCVRNFPTVLQIALGVLMRDSKALFTKLHEFGVTCSYDEVLQFKKSAAVGLLQ